MLLKLTAIILVIGKLYAEICVADWAKCGGIDWTTTSTCCNTHYYCKYTDAYYSECVPNSIVPFPPAPASSWCGFNGMTMNSNRLSSPGNASPFEIANMWSAATQGLTSGHKPGGQISCVEAVTIALGECGHTVQSNWRTIHDPVCNFKASGPAGIWQVEAQDSSDDLLAGCSNGYDVCCNARLAYAHAYYQGGATVLPQGYCAAAGDCSQIYSNCGGLTGPTWNNVQVDLTYKYDYAPIPDCNNNTNPWYPDGGAMLSSPAVDQEPCYWGPFPVTAGSVGKTFFNGFYGWGGYYQHYVESRAGACDNSPQCASMSMSDCNTNPTYDSYPTYYQLAIDACDALNDDHN